MQVSSSLSLAFHCKKTRRLTKVRVISNPPVAAKGLIRPVRGVLEALGLCLFNFWPVRTCSICMFLPILSLGRNKKLKSLVFPLGSLQEKEIALLLMLISGASWFRPVFASCCCLHLFVCSLLVFLVQTLRKLQDGKIKILKYLADLVDIYVPVHIWNHASVTSKDISVFQSWKTKLFRNWHLCFFLISVWVEFLVQRE